MTQENWWTLEQMAGERVKGYLREAARDGLAREAMAARVGVRRAVARALRDLADLLDSGSRPLADSGLLVAR